MMSDKVRDAANSGIENATDKAKSAAEWAADKADHAKDSAKGLVDLAQQRAKNVTNTVADAATKVRDKGEQWVGDAADSVQTAVTDGYAYAQNGLEHFGRDMTAVIRKHPMTAVAIGLGLGLLLGRAASSRG